MSGDSYRSYDSSASRYRGFASADADERRRAETARAERVAESRTKIEEGNIPEPPKRNVEDLYDRHVVRLGIKTPPKSAKRLHVALVDNSGSNRKIAEHTRQSSGYLLSTLGIIDGASALAINYFSDHCDGDRLMQEVDWVLPNEKGDRQLLSSMRHVEQASGGDEAEAIECALARACELNFGSLPKEARHLYLITDVVAHGMGMRDDRGCPDQRSWRKSLESVSQTYGSFEVIGSGDDSSTAKLQAQFIAPDRLAYDLIDLSEVRETEHRMRITTNSLLLLIARRNGLQSVQTFLMALYEKWLAEPIFGANTDLSAREAIRRFLKYLEIGAAERRAFEDKIFAE